MKQQDKSLTLGNRCGIRFRIAAPWIIAAITTIPNTICSTAKGADSPFRAYAEEIAKGAGTFVRATPRSEFGPVFLFEEHHNSRAGQIQIATMLVRLYHRGNLRTVALEGAIKNGRPLPARQFLDAANAVARHDTLKHLLRDGEISGAEYAGASLPNLKVMGIEDASEYAVKLTGDANCAAAALLTIAQKTQPQEALRGFLAALSDKTRSLNDSRQAAIDILTASDPWLKTHFNVLGSKDSSPMDLVATHKAILDKARHLTIELGHSMISDLQSAIHFYEVAEKRSITMAKNTAALCLSSPREALALVVGAAHSSRIMAELESRGITVVLLRPLDFRGDGDEAGVHALSNKHDGKWANDQPRSLGAILNDDDSTQHKPQPIIGDLEREGFASVQAAAIIAARAIRTGQKFPDAVANELKALRGIVINSTAFKKDGADVIFPVSVKDIYGKKREIWVRAGTVTSNPDNEDELGTALIVLEKAEKEGKPSIATTPEADAKPNDEVANRDNREPETKEEPPVSITTRDVQMLFFKSNSEAAAAKRISDL